MQTDDVQIQDTINTQNTDLGKMCWQATNANKLCCSSTKCNFQENWINSMYDLQNVLEIN